MNKTILVIGSVTAKENDILRRKILRQGHKPVIKRVDRDDLILGEGGLYKTYATAEEKQSLEDQHGYNGKIKISGGFAYELFTGVCGNHLGSRHFSKIFEGVQYVVMDYDFLSYFLRYSPSSNLSHYGLEGIYYPENWDSSRARLNRLV